MHPILSRLSRLALYLLAWIPLAALLAYLIAATGGLTGRQAISLSFPLCFLYAFVCLSAWYSCRAIPSSRSTIGKLLEVHVAAALVASGLWVLCAELLAYIFTAMSFYPGFTGRLSRTLPILFSTGVILYLFSVCFYYLLLALEASQAAEAQAIEARVLARDAELRALKAQVNPHFLFNSLNSISALTNSDAAKAREMCILLGDFLRRTLGLGEKSTIPLAEEMSLIHAFLAVEKIRFGARFHMEENIADEALKLDIPPLLLQPLVENAFTHGISNLVEGGWVRLDAHCQNGVLSIVVENSFDPDAPPRRQKNGLGLLNVRQRLGARYGDRATFNVRTEGDTFSVAIALPAESEGRAT
jgi:two-component system, LytTR family, sensor histidine kinase AlgZ